MITNDKQIEFKFSKNLMIMKVDNTHYIYSNHVNFPIGEIKEPEDSGNVYILQISLCILFDIFKIIIIIYFFK